MPDHGPVLIGKHIPPDLMTEDIFVYKLVDEQGSRDAPAKDAELSASSDTFTFKDVEDDAAVTNARSTEADDLTLQPDVNASGWPLLVEAIEQGTSMGDIEPVVGPDGTLLLCRESTGECIEWPSG